MHIFTVRPCASSSPVGSRHRLGRRAGRVSPCCLEIQVERFIRMAAIAAAAGKAQLTARLATVARKKRKVNSDTCEIIYIFATMR